MKELRAKVTNKKAGVIVPFGYDEEKKHIIAMELENSDRPNMLVHGLAGSGKTTLLKSIVNGLNNVYDRKDILISVIDASIGGDWKDFLCNGHKHITLCNDFCYVNPAMLSIADRFDYYSAMAEYRSKSITMKDYDDIDEFNAYEEEKFKTVVIIIDEYQRFIGTASEKSFVRLVNAISNYGYNTDMHLIMSSQSSKGTKVALTTKIWDDFGIKICLKADELTQKDTVGSLVNFGKHDFDGYYLTYGADEPVKFYVGGGTDSDVILLINEKYDRMAEEAARIKAATNEFVKSILDK